MTPETLGRYEILGELGKGAMGVVYLAQDPIIRRKLAIKTFRMAYSAKEKEVEQFRERFLREAQAVGQLSHPNIVTVHDIGQEDDEYFIAMEYVKGVDLKQRMQRHDGPLPLDFVVPTAAQIADGLACAHAKSIVHRDIKPANVIITKDQQVKITDFGIARTEQSNLTVAGQLLGTPNYMAPEQIQGKQVDSRTDIFSLGVVLYEMLTRKKPFQGENLTQVSHRIVYDEYTPPDEYVSDLPPLLLEVLRTALEKDPEKRYQDAAEMSRDLRMIVPAEPVSGVVPIVTPQPPPPAAPPTETPPPAVPPTETPPPGPPPMETPPPVPPPMEAPPMEASPAATPLMEASPAIAPPPPEAAPPEIPPPPAPAPAPEPEKPPPPSSSRSPGGRPPTVVKSRAAKSPRPAKARRGWGGMSLAAMGLLAVAVLGLAALAVARILDGGEPAAEPLEISAVESFLERENQAIQEAEDLAAAGAPEQALMVLRGAMDELPFSLGLTRTYLEAAREVDGRRDIVADYVRERMAAAEERIENEDYEEAYDVLERVLLADPHNETAQDRADTIERFLNRRRQSQIQATRRGKPRVSPPPPPPAVAPPPPTAQATGELRIAFRTLIAEGKVTVYAKEEVIFQKAFNFPNRKTFKRRYLRGERGYDEVHVLPAGTVVDLRAEVEVVVKEGRKTLKSDLVRGSVSPETSPQLRITVGEDLIVKTTWMP